MLNNGQSKVIEDIIAYINDNIKTDTKTFYPLFTFNELSTTKDSCCLTTSENKKPEEKNADVTGLFKAGVVTLDVIYRVLEVEDGIDDLIYINKLDGFIDWLRSKQKELKSSTYFVDNVVLISNGSLDKIYSGGIKDFKATFQINYEREVN